MARDLSCHRSGSGPQVAVTESIQRKFEVGINVEQLRALIRNSSEAWGLLYARDPMHAVEPLIRDVEWLCGSVDHTYAAVSLECWVRLPNTSLHLLIRSPHESIACDQYRTLPAAWCLWMIFVLVSISLIRHRTFGKLRQYNPFQDSAQVTLLLGISRNSSHS